MTLLRLALTGTEKSQVSVFWQDHVHFMYQSRCPLTKTIRHGLQTHEAAQIQIPSPNKYLGFGYKGLVFCRNNG